MRFGGFRFAFAALAVAGAFAAGFWFLAFASFGSAPSNRTSQAHAEQGGSEDPALAAIEKVGDEQAEAEAHGGA